jgi:hypothetical protein
MKALAALAIVTGGTVVAFAIYTFAWHKGRSARTIRPAAPGHNVYTLSEGDVVIVPGAAARCEVSGEAGIPNFYCVHTGRTGYQVFLWKDRADLYDLERHGEPMVPTYSVQGLRTRSCGTLSVDISWHLRASPNVRCSSARRLMTVYFRRRANLRPGAFLRGYGCSRRDLRDGEHIRCVRGAALVTANSFGH